MLSAKDVTDGSILGLGFTFGGWIGLAQFPWAGIVVLAFDVAAVVRLLIAARDPGERPRAVGLLAVGSTMLIAAAGVLFSRGGFADRNALPLAFHGAAVVMAFRVYPLPVGRIASSIFGIGLAALIVVGNWAPGIEHGRVHKFFFDSLRDDLAAGMPTNCAADKYAQPIYSPTDPTTNRRLAGFMDGLRRHHIGWFATATGPPPAVELPARLPADPAIVGPGVKGFTLPGPDGRVSGVRIRFTSPQPAPLVEVDVAWTTPDGTAEKALVWLRLEPGESTRTFWVRGAVRDLTIHSCWPTPPLTVTEVVWLMNRVSD
jgi:hypothetical protein